MGVVVELRGGLGNQLFQYGAGLALAARLETPLILDTALLPGSTVDRNGVRRWPEQISTFRHSGTIVDRRDKSELSKRARQMKGTLERLVGDTPFGRLSHRRLFAHENREDLNRFTALPNNSRINSYCGSPLFFAGSEMQLREEVRSVTDPSEWFEREQVVMNEVRPISLHVRWGDYLNLKHVYGEISHQYYERAVRHIRDLGAGDAPVWLFSDDPIGASHFLKSSIQIDRVVVPHDTSSALENMLLLGGGAGLVAANSSFSWWAGFTAVDSKSPIVFPRPMFGPSGPPEPKHWLLDDWIQLGRS